MIRVVCVLTYFLLAQGVFAANDDVVIGTLIRGEATPPTVPDNVTLNPLTTTQIDIHWDASTDNQVLVGYNVLRNNVVIATTSLTEYSDTGLAPDTTYTYTVRAYDDFFDYSALSTSTATTTLQTQHESGGTGSMFIPRLVDLDIQATEHSMILDWKTNIYVRYVLRWGRSSIHELGFVQGDTYKRHHITRINNLEPGTVYTYQLIAYNQQGKEFVLSEDSFVTKHIPDIQAPLNVSGLYAVIVGDSVRLFWKNPQDVDFAKIRIVRNYTFYPGDPSNGYIAYEGTAESFVDQGVLRAYDAQYYTIFSYDETGNISSGAVILVQQNEVRGTDSGATEDTNQSTSSQNSNTPITIDFSHVLVLQNNVRIEPLQGIVPVFQSLPVVLQIPYESLPEHLKTIIVTIQGNRDNTVSYMLRVNKDKSAYEALIPPLTFAGEYVFTFSIYDYRTELLTTFEGDILAKQMPIVTQLSQQTFSTNTVVVFILFLLLMCLAIWHFITTRERRD